MTRLTTHYDTNDHTATPPHALDLRRGENGGRVGVVRTIEDSKTFQDCPIMLMR
jgi:hypothetical protein